MRPFLTSSAVLVLLVVSPGYATSFDFNNGTNQGWTRAGFYDADATMEPIPGAFESEPAPWSPDYSSPDSPPAPSPPPNHGAIIMGVSGFTPLSPNGNGWIFWDFVSPPLNTDPVWGEPISFTYDVLGDIASSSDAINSVQTVWHVIKPDLTESYYSDFVYHPITHMATSWQEFGAKATFLPAGTTVLDIIFHVFFWTSSEYDGFIALDNIRPVLLGDMDGDGDVDPDDTQPFVLGLVDPDGYEAAFGLSASLKGDLDQDGDIDFDDIPGFVSLLPGETLSSSGYTVPEPSTLLLTAFGLFGLSGAARVGTRRGKTPSFVDGQIELFTFHLFLASSR